MKRILTIFFMLVCAFTLTVTGFAEGVSEASESNQEFASDSSTVTEDNVIIDSPQDDVIKADNPAEYWKRCGYPDDISYAYKAGGMIESDGTEYTYWEIGVINASDERKAELRALFTDTDLITFTDVKYPYYQRAAVLTEIIMEVKETHDDNYVFGSLILNTDQVYIVVKDEAYEEYAARYTERYGDIVLVERESDRIYLTEDNDGTTIGIIGIIPEGAGSIDQNQWVIPTMIAFAALVLIVVLFVNRAKLVPAMQTSTGEVVEAQKPLSKAQTIAVVKENKYTPKDSTFAEITEKLKND